MNDNSFEFSMETLLKQDHVTENHRSGKIAYSVKLPETVKIILKILQTTLSNLKVMLRISYLL